MRDLCIDIKTFNITNECIYKGTLNAAAILSRMTYMMIIDILYVFHVLGYIHKGTFCHPYSVTSPPSSKRWIK